MIFFWHVFGQSLYQILFLILGDFSKIPLGFLGLQLYHLQKQFSSSFPMFIPVFKVVIIKFIIYFLQKF